ncbi:type II toxin-antitoxin system RelE/ParE family toxin [Pusillimonas caeni]|uniref:type II toxin-antitoxin system RelE/ParE family toxin n=1 Tax=Pusillimonas caeni TaxID=1348472 RepID=UPI001FD7E67D|nr:type II toxin-antitoxin system RelE/ParE family toxin [Pusillimonas caeni]
MQTSKLVDKQLRPRAYYISSFQQTSGVVRSFIHTQFTYTIKMKASFIELPAFQRHREHYMDDATLRNFQSMLLQQPEAGDVMAGTGGLRKARFIDLRRGKGKRGGLRVIYYQWVAGRQFWLFTVYDKGEMNDLSAKERAILATLLQNELEARTL